MLHTTSIVRSLGLGLLALGVITGCGDDSGSGGESGSSGSSSGDTSGPTGGPTTAPTTTMSTTGPTGSSSADGTMSTDPTGETSDPTETTAPTTDTGETTGPLVFGPFEDITPIDVLNTDGTEDDPTLRADLLEIYFASNRDGTEDLFRAVRDSVDDPWGAPEPVTELNLDVSAESTPELTADGLTLYFASNRMSGQGELDLYVATRDAVDDPWGDPAPVDSLNTVDGEGALVLTADALGGYFCRGQVGQGAQLFSATRDALDGDWTATTVDALNTTNDDCSPFVTAGDASLLFGSIRRGGVGGVDLWESTIEGGDFGRPVLVSELAEPGVDDDPWLSEDGAVIVFASDRDGTMDIFTATRTLQ